jgi:transposase
MDMSAEFRRAVRTALPKATVTVDHWHVVARANQMVTEVRRRSARDLHGRRGRAAAEDRSHRCLPPLLGRARTRREGNRDA